jgi:hypothetical protein
MRVRTIQVANYKGFEETPPLDLDSHMNVIVGQNHSGKTGLIEAMALRFDNKSHFSSKLRDGEFVPPGSFVEVTLDVSGSELVRTVLRNPNQTILNYPTDFTKDPASWVNRLMHEGLRIPLRISGGQAFLAHNFPIIQPGTDRCQLQKKAPVRAIRLAIDRNRRSIALGDFVNHSGTDSSDYIVRTLLGETYLFQAERLNLGICKIGPHDRLYPNASNLGEVLLNLQSRSKNSNPM